MTTFSGDFPITKDIVVAKNYLTEEELRILNGIVSGYFDFAEVQAMRRHVMHMSDYVEHLDNLLKSTGEKLLEDAGTVSHKQAMEKAKEVTVMEIALTKKLADALKMKPDAADEGINPILSWTASLDQAMGE